MDEILRALAAALSDVESVDNLVDQEVNEDAAPLRSAFGRIAQAIADASQAAAQLRDARSGLVATAVGLPVRSPIDDGN